MDFSLFFDLFEMVMCSYTFIFIGYYFLKTNKIKYKKLKNDEILVVISSYELKDFVIKNIERIKKDFKNIVVLTVEDNNKKITGVDIIKTPKHFKCNAIYKGRDLLYFAKEYKIPNNVKWILFLDEDSIPEVPIEIPVGSDVVVLSETVEKHKNPIITISELQRRSFGMEEYLFLNFMNLPLYLWGGGLLVKKDLINLLPDYPTVIEDTMYGWNIFKKLKNKIKFARSKTKIHSCPPKNLKTMFKQRARWFMGTVFDVNKAPTDIKYITKIRLFYWVTSLPFYIFTDPFMKLLATISFTIQSFVGCKEQEYPWYYMFTWLIGAIMNTIMAWTAPIFQRNKKFDVTKKSCEKECEVKI